jgi:hypothetical protein
MKEVLDAIIEVNRNIEHLRADVNIRLKDVEDDISEIKSDVKPMVIKFKQWVIMKRLIGWGVGTTLTLGGIITLFTRLF